MKRFLKLSNGIVYVLFAAVTVYLFLLSLFSTCVMGYTDEHIFYLKDAALFLSGGLVIFCFLITWLGKKLRGRGETIRRGLLILMFLWLLFMGAFILFLNLKPYYDPGSVYEAAAALLRGDYTEWQQGGYLYTFPFQNGLVLLECPFWLIFGERAYLAIQFYNAFLWLGTMLAMSWLGAHFFNRRTGEMVFAALLLFFPMWSYVTYCYGTVPGLAVGVFAVCLELKYEETEKLSYLFGSALLLFLAVMYKSNYAIFAVAVAIMLLLHAVREKKWKSAVGIFLIFSAVFLEGQLIPAIMGRITGADTGNGIPMIAWVAMGLKESNIAPGWYNRFTVLTYEENFYHTKLVTQASLNSIKETFRLFLSDKGYMLRFFGRKMASLWNSPEFECFTTITKRNVEGTLPYWLKDILYNGGMVNTILFLLLDIYQSILYFGTVLYLILKRKELELQKAVCAIIFLGGFLFHLFWEGKCQYTVLYYIMLFPYAMAGYEILGRKMESAIRENKLMVKIGKTASGRMGIALAVIILLLAVTESSVLSSTLKPAGDESDYLWFCTYSADWQDAGYHFGDSYE